MITDPRSVGRGIRFIAAGTELAASVVAGVIAGYYLDRYLGSAPWLTLLFTLAGLIGGLTRLFWTLKQLERTARSDEDAENRHPHTR